jgi:hypothetical protein
VAVVCFGVALTPGTIVGVQTLRACTCHGLWICLPTNASGTRSHWGSAMLSMLIPALVTAAAYPIPKINYWNLIIGFALTIRGF